jgi:ferredoxin--NADP+ reductase/benzoate/toluate 1,2-dioxygenase reductase subunit
MKDKDLTEQTITKLDFKVHEIRLLTPTTYVLRFDKHHLSFKAGQYIRVGLPGNRERREYSIYSGENDDYFEILIKEVIDGDLSKKLKRLKGGDNIVVEGPFGFFNLNANDLFSRKFYLIASGTGISPFHSYVRSYPDMDYTLIHGIKFIEETYEKDHYDSKRYLCCTSRDEKGDFSGRVTKIIPLYPFENNALFYLCGNSDMVYDVYNLLADRGISTDNIFTEVYF